MPWGCPIVTFTKIRITSTKVCENNYLIPGQKSNNISSKPSKYHPFRQCCQNLIKKFIDFGDAMNPKIKFTIFELGKGAGGRYPGAEGANLANWRHVSQGKCIQRTNLCWAVSLRGYPDNRNNAVPTDMLGLTKFSQN